MDTHLSFSAIYKKEGEIFVCPENSELGYHHLYKYDGVVYRPAQVCNTAYGQAVSLQRVEKKDDVIIW